MGAAGGAEEPFVLEGSVVDTGTVLDRVRHGLVLNIRLDPEKIAKCINDFLQYWGIRFSWSSYKSSVHRKQGDCLVLLTEAEGGTTKKTHFTVSMIVSILRPIECAAFSRTA